MIGERPLIDEEMALDTALKNVRRQNYFIMLEIEKNNLRFCLKQTFTLLCELRSHLLSPKMYHELFSKVENELIPVYNYMNVEISRGREAWDIYESVQQCMYVIPRLYLVIVAGAIYIENSPEKCKEIMDELLEFMKEAQSPVRGIFVRYYLARMMKGRLPDGDNRPIKEGGCTILDTISFLTKNLEEMNRCWIRMTLNASIDEKPILEKERYDLKTLISDAIEMLSKLEGLNMDLYDKEILPKIIEIIFMYDDPISQEFILECIVRHFPVSYNIKNLDFLLLTLSKLGKEVNKTKLFVIILEKLNNYYKENKDKEESEEKEKILNEIYGAYPIILRNYNIIIKKQEKAISNILDILEINLNFIKFCVICAPEEEKLISINHGLSSTSKSLFASNISLLFQDQLNKIYEILSLALESIYSIFEMPDFIKLFNFLDYQNKKKLAIGIINNLSNVNSHEKLDTLEKIQQLIVFLKPLSKSLNSGDTQENERLIEREQYTLIKLFSVFKTKDLELLYNFYIEFKNFLIDSGKTQRSKSLPCLICSLLIFCRNINNLYENKIEDDAKYDITVLNTEEEFYNYLSKIYEIIIELLKTIEQDNLNMAFNYSFLIMNQINEINTSKEKFSDICLSIFNNAFEIYKKFETEKKFQYFNYICENIINYTILPKDVYEKIIEELINEAKNMQKRSEQCNGLLIISKIYYKNFKDGKKVLEYLSKAKKIAGFSLTNQKNLVLFINILNEYLYYVESDKENVVEITKEHIEEVIEYIQNFMVTIKSDKNSDLSFLKEIEIMFNRSINLINERKNKDNYNEIYGHINFNIENEV